jgi:hypothetical protein
MPTPAISRLLLGLSIVLFIAALHVIAVGSYLPLEMRGVYASYFSDVAIPLAFYFILCAAERRPPWMRRWQARLAASVLLPSIAETCQWGGIPLLGSTFDPMDYLMYGIGAGLGVALDAQVFARMFAFWREEPSE